MHVPGTDGISAHELTQWQAFERLEGPLDGRRIDYAAAQIAQMLVALQTKKGKKPPKLNEFVIKWEDKPKGSGLELLHKIILANRMLEGDDERNAKLPPVGED